MKKQKRFNPFLTIKLRSIKIVAFLMLCLALLSSSFGGQGSLASVFFAGTSRKLPIYCVQNENKQIALTFDAAWGSDKTQKILDILKENNITATFFLVGMWVDKNQELVKSIDSQGIEIGTHSNTHPDFTKLSAKQMEFELATSKNKIEALTGKKVKIFRAPFGAYNNTVLSVAESQNLQTIQWDVDSLDWKGISATKIANNILKKTTSGSIILCHNNADFTPDAVPSVISNLKSRGYTFVHVSDLLIKENFTINHAGKQIKA